MDQATCLQNFFFHQNLSLRKQIRQIDFIHQENNYARTENKPKIINFQKNSESNDANFLVVGPHNSGKSSLLKTIHIALNSNLNFQTATVSLSNRVVKRYDIKKSRKYKIQGLKSIKQTDQKQSITGFQIEQKSLNDTSKLSTGQRLDYFMKKYSTILQLIDQKVLGCCKMTSLNITNQIISNTIDTIGENQNSTLTSLANVKVVLVVIDVMAKVEKQELSCLKFFISDTRDKSIKNIVVLTNCDKLNHLKDNDRLAVIEGKINRLKKDLEIEDRDDFICFENYKTFVSLNEGYNQNPEKFQYLNLIRPKPYADTFSKTNVPFHLQDTRSSIKPFKDSRYEYETQQKQQKYEYKLKQKIDNKLNSSYFIDQNYKPIQRGEGDLRKLLYKSDSQIFGSFFQNNEEINYYGLKLLVRIIRQCEKHSRTDHFNGKRLIDWLCG